MNIMEETPGVYRIEIDGLSMRQIKDILENEWGALMWSGGKAYPSDHVKVRFFTPKKPERQPLTVAEVEAILARWSYELHGDRARFIVRETEIAHGIGEKK